MKFCYQDGDRMVCVPMWVDPLWWLRVPFQSMRPSPIPWISDELLDPVVAQDLSIITAVAKMADSLSPGLKENISELDLPQGAKVVF